MTKDVKKFRIHAESIEYVYIDIEAETKEEARKKRSKI